MSANKKKKQVRVNWKERFSNFWKKHWFWYTVILASPSIWFSVVLQFLGNTLKMLNDNGQLTVLGIWVTLVIIVVVGGISFINNNYLSKTELGKLEILSGKVDYLSAVIDSIDRICDEKYLKLKNKIVEYQDETIPRAEIISAPNNQLRKIVDAITECLVKLLANQENGFSFKDFTVTIAYNFPQENGEWKWAEGTAEKDMGLQDLLTNNSSTYRYLLNSEDPYYFNNKKEEARQEGKYIYNPQDVLSDKNQENIGSIFCYRYKVKKNTTVYVDSMISISTQRKCFSADNKESCRNVRDNMVSLIKESFGKRIGIELSLLYLEHLKNKISVK